MEATMKKFAFVFIIFFTLFVISDIALAATDSQYDKALTYYNSGKYKEAVSIFKEYIKKLPQTGDVIRLALEQLEINIRMKHNQLVSD